MKRLTAIITTLVVSFVWATVAAAMPANPQVKMEQLGKKLFFDTRLSKPEGQACATCHAPAAGFAGPKSLINALGAVYPGAIPVRFGNRRPPTAAYASTSPVFGANTEEDPTGFFHEGGNFWDGRATGDVLGNPAADQAQGPFLNKVEQNMASKQAVVAKVCSGSYADTFKAVGYDVFGVKVCAAANTDKAYDLIGMAIGVYEDSREVNAFSSKYDLYLKRCIAGGYDPAACARGFVDPLNPTVFSGGFASDPTGTFSALQWTGFQFFVAENNNDGIRDDGEGALCAACHIIDFSEPTPTAYSQVLNKIDPSYPLEIQVLPPLFTDYTFDNLGVAKNPLNTFYRMDKVFVGGQPINPLGKAWIDSGLGGSAAACLDLAVQDYAACIADNYGKQKVPTLRNVDKRPYKGFVKAYMHNGVLKTLEDVVRFYSDREAMIAAGDLVPEVADTRNQGELGQLALSADAVKAVAAFMKTLSDGYWKP